jgi:hypothetical protein
MEYLNAVVDGEINEVINGDGPCYSYFSLEPSEFNDKGVKEVRLVIGANFNDNCASHFSKKSLGELIETLKKVQEAMVEYEADNND